MILVCLMEFSQARGHLSNSKVEKLSLTPKKESTKVSVCDLYQYMPRKNLNIFWKIEPLDAVGKQKKSKQKS